ncbi:T9SS type A sorting domain-containing protein, partial [candidate division KSB1 bacterium]|nr:T9SS type A sorting domain-containing protein [candidate division KSB1 bacterium]
MRLKSTQSKNGLKINLFTLFSILTFLLCDSSFLFAQLIKYNDFRSRKYFINDSLLSLDQRMHKFELKHKAGYEGTTNFKKSMIEELSINLGNDEWTTNGPYLGGIFLSIVVAPSDSNIVYAISDGIGLYKSIDAGMTWTFVEALKVRYINTIAIDPNNPEIVYAMDYKCFYKSTDSGATWHKKDKNISAQYLSYGIIINPENSDVIYIGATNEILKSEDGGETWRTVLDSGQWFTKLIFDPTDTNIIYAADMQGVWRSEDSGDTWDSLNSGFPDYPYIYGLAVDPSNPDILYAGSNGLYRSTDQGANWSLIGLEGKRVFWGIKVDPTDPQCIHVGTREGYYKTLDGGSTWNHIEGIPSYTVYDIEQNPQSSNILFVGTYCNGIFKSFDSGETWSHLKMNSKNRIVEIAIASDNADIIFAASRNGGIFRSQDRGKSWEQKNNGLLNLSVNSVVVDPSNSNIVYCCSDADVYKSTDGAGTWQTINTGLENILTATSLAIAPWNPNTLFVTTLNGLYRTKNGGGNWESIGFKGKYLNGAIAIHPFSPDTIYQGIWDEGIYRTENGGIDWVLIDKNIENYEIVELAIDIVNPDIIYASTYKYGVFKSHDKGDNWEYSGLRGYYIYDLIIDDLNPDILYAGSLGDADGGVFISINGAQNWAGLNRGLSSRYIFNLAIHPNDHYHLFAGTSYNGVWDYTIQNLPPIVQILQPEQIIFEYEEPITFIGYANDQEEGSLSDSSLVWYSSLQGELGRGDTITVNTLLAGKHTILFSGEDNFGMTNQDSIEINILPEDVELISILEAENDMTPIANIYDTDGIVGWWLRSNGSLVSNQSVHFPEKRTYAFNLIAKGTNVNGWPQCDLIVGKNLEAKRIEINSSDYTEFIVPAIIDSGDFLVDVTFTNHYSKWYEGSRNFALDKTIITAPTLADHDVAVQSILSPENNMNPAALVVPKIQLNNFGKNNENNVNVTCTVDKIDSLTSQEVYRHTQSIPRIEMFDEIEVAFKAFATPGDGIYLFKFFHNLAGDQNTSNDSLSIQISTAHFIDASDFADVADAGNGFGVAVGDYDLDNYIDLYHTKHGNNVLFHNAQNGKFGDRAPDEGLEDYGNDSRSAGWFDYDNDGDLDLIILNNNGIALYRNDNGSFAEVTNQTNFGGEENTLGLALGDYNNDGYLDIYATRYDHANFLYSNNGNGTFSDIAARTGVQEFDCNSSAAFFWDFDRDNDQDLFVVNHTQNHHLFRNNGDTTFTEVAETVGISHGGNGHHAMIFDYNNDGLLDLYIINSAPHAFGNILYRNNGGTFSNVTEAAGVGDDGDGYGGSYGDFDYDGYVDFYVVNADGENLLYHNNSDGTFTNIAAKAGVDNSNVGRGAAVADFDHDNDLDIYLVNYGQANVLYYNTGTSNNWLQVEVEGILSNRDGIGTLIEVFANGQRFCRLVDGNAGYGSQSSLIAEFGLGQLSQIDSVVIHWPSGIKQDTTHVAVNQLVHISESVLAHDVMVASILSPKDRTTIGLPLIPEILIKNFGAGNEHNFNVVCIIDTSGYEIYRDLQQVELLDASSDKKITFSEFIPDLKGHYRFTFFTDLSNDQKNKNDTLFTTTYASIPFYIDLAENLNIHSSKNSRGVAFGDYNNDGYLDIYLTNGGQANNLYKNTGKGTFSNVTFSARVGNRQMGGGSIFGDYDNDGYLDIYVTNEGQANILYHNNGKGAFSNISSVAGVNHSGIGYCSAFGDYDNDGYLDIYISNDNDQETNVMYRNNGDGTFSDVTAITGLDKAGWTAGVTFGDYDNDNDQDIIVANRIGNCALYRNNGDGTFSDVGIRANIAYSGNAHSVSFGDFNNDRALDLFITNGELGKRDCLYRMNKYGLFTNTSIQAGIEKRDEGAAATFLDYDYDGYLDIYIGGYYNDILYRNNGDETFTDISNEIGLSDNSICTAVAVGDYDKDGDLDIYVANTDKNYLYQNQGTPNNWLIVKTVGTISNRDGIGARVTAVSESFTQIREVNGGSGLASQNMLPVAFGLANDTTVDSLIIRWPSGIRQVSTNVAVNQYIIVKEDSALIAVDESDRTSAILPAAFSLGQNFPNPFNPDTKIKYQLPINSYVQISVYNVTGKLVKTLVNENQQAGFQSVTWHGKDDKGFDVSSGVYLYQIKAQVEN